jgi:integrase
MSPEQLLETLIDQHHMTHTRKKDILTSIRKLAKALDVGVDALDAAALELTYEPTLKDYFSHLDPQPSAYTQRNTFQNLGQLYRVAHASGLLQTPSQRRVRGSAVRMLTEMNNSGLYRHRFTGLQPYLVPCDQWPPWIREPWIAFRDERAFDVRPESIRTYENKLTIYVSYCLQFEVSPPTSWDHLFEVGRLLRFITWHANRMGAKRITPSGKEAFNTVLMLARHGKRPECPALQERYRKLPIPEPMHNKQDPRHTISAQEFESVGLALLGMADAAPPRIRTDKAVVFKGLHKAIIRRDALLIRLMWRIPMRNRSFREMQLEKNLDKDADGRWTLFYRGDELKVEERRGRINTFVVPFPPSLVDHLEAYLTNDRPKFPQASSSPYVFLNRFGRPFNRNTLRNVVALAVYTHLKKRFYPHLSRTLWVDRYLLATGDVSTAAYMLNDNVLTVMKRYHELRGADHTAKAFEFNEAILGNGKPNGKRTSR